MDELSPEVEKVYCSLKDKVFKAMDYLQIPEYEQKKHQNLTSTRPIDNAEIFGVINILHEQDDKIALRGCHMMRTGLYSILLMDHAGIKNKEWRQNMFIAYLWHDDGKAILEGSSDNLPININKPFTEKEMEIMKLHVESEQLGDLFNPTIKSIVARHHFYRKHSPYPKNPWGEETPEVKYAAQRLGIFDSSDAAATRLNNKTKLTLIDKLLQRKFQSQKLIKEHLLEEYGDLKLDYQGDIFPHVKQTGEQFIEEMYSTGIFGSENRLNPFENLEFIK